jgi:hypothetical protein
MDAVLEPGGRCPFPGRVILELVVNKCIHFGVKGGINVSKCLDLLSEVGLYTFGDYQTANVQKGL